MRKKTGFPAAVIVIAAVLIMMTLPVSEADAATSASDFAMEGSTLVKYLGSDEYVSVPTSVEVIGESAFEGNTSVKRVTIPDSVKRIDSYAFWGCSKLETVSLGGGLSGVGDYAFAGCGGLKQMTLPANIVSIGIQAFGDCVNMTYISIPAETLNIHETAFDGCIRLTIRCEEGTVADTYAQAFYERQKEMPGYGEIPDGEPGHSGEEPADPLPASTPDYSEGEILGSTSIVGNHAMVFLNAEDMKVLWETPKKPSGGEFRENLVDLAEMIAFLFPSEAVENIPKHTVVDGRIIADQAFYRNASLSRTVLPAGIVEIGQFSFARSSLTEIVLPDGVVSIDYGAFYHCDSLSNVVLPDTVMNVEPKAFEHTAWVENFRNGDEDFLVSGGVLVAYNGDETQVSVPGGVRVIAAEAFAGHGELERVKLPDSVIVVGEAAFEGCQALRRVDLGQGVEQIKDRAFAGCGSLEQLTLPASVKAVGLQAMGTADVVYRGKMPEATYESSATRLDNGSYRGVEPDTSAPGVTVIGAQPSSARLAGNSGSYQLAVAQAADRTSMETAWQRAKGGNMPENMTVYDLRLTDSSGIPLNSLGSSLLTVVLPVPENLTGQRLRLTTLDRNGQLEALAVERVMLDGQEMFRFRAGHLSLIGVYGAGE